MSENQDLLGYLYEEFISEQDNHHVPTLYEFIQWARNHLAENQPVSTSMMGASVAVTLQSGHQILFVDNEGDEQTPMQSSGPATPVTTPKTGRRGGSMAPPTDTPITSP